MKASAFRRWPVAGAYSPEQTTRLTGGSDLLAISVELVLIREQAEYREEFKLTWW